MDMAAGEALGTGSAQEAEPAEAGTKNMIMKKILQEFGGTWDYKEKRG